MIFIVRLDNFVSFIFSSLFYFKKKKIGMKLWKVFVVFWVFNYIDICIYIFLYVYIYMYMYIYVIYIKIKIFVFDIINISVYI